MAAHRSMSAWSYKHWCTHAELLASCRQDCWCDAQLEILDRLIGRFIEVYSDDAPGSFDPQWFADKAKRGFYRITNTLVQGEIDEQGQQHHHHRQPDP